MKELKSKGSQSNSEIFIKYLIWWTEPIISWISIIQYTVKHTDNVLLAFSSLRRCNVSFWWYAAEVGALSLPRGQRISRRGGICWSPWHWDKGLCIWNMNVSVINDKHIMKSYTWWNLTMNLIIKGTEYVILSFSAGWWPTGSQWHCWCVLSIEARTFTDGLHKVEHGSPWTGFWFGCSGKGKKKTPYALFLNFAT